MENSHVSDSFLCFDIRPYFQPTVFQQNTAALTRLQR